MTVRKSTTQYLQSLSRERLKCMSACICYLVKHSLLRSRTDLAGDTKDEAHHIISQVLHKAGECTERRHCPVNQDLEVHDGTQRRESQGYL